MKKHRKLLLPALLVLLLVGSAASAAANYSAGRGMAPSIEGASDAFDMASQAITSTTSSLISLVRSASTSAFSYGPSSSAQPAEVPNTPQQLPMYGRGSVTTIAVDPYFSTYSSADPSFIGGLQPQELPLIASAAGPTSTISPLDFPNTSAAPSSSTPFNSIPVVTPTTPVPEPLPYAMLLTGIVLMSGVAYRRRALVK